MTTMIVACEILKYEIEAAQEKLGTNYPIEYIDGGLHSVPKKLREALAKKLYELPEEVDTVLLGMALCGNAIVEFVTPKRLVVPRMDDCLTMFLHTDDTRHANLKEVGHMYLTDGYLQVKNFIKDEYDSTLEKYGERRCQRMVKMLYKGYTSVDVIDVGTYDAYTPEFTELVQGNAEIIGCPACHVPGSNIIIEKLLAGKWDNQFFIAEAGTTLDMMNFM